MTEQGDAGNRAEHTLRLIASGDLAELMAIWNGRDAADWSRAPQIYRALSEAILKKGEPLLAYDVIKEGLGALPGDVRLRQLQGLSLARSGATDRANAVLESLRKEGQVDEETLGMLGRTYKDLAMHATSADECQQDLERAANIYSEGFTSTGGYWSGINAATMNLLVGKVEVASALAAKVQEQCRKVLDDGNNYWALAALGEAALIVKNWSEAEDWYARAAQAGSGRYGDLCSTRRNAHLILQYWKTDTNRIDKLLCIPPVVAFAGHMIDRADRAEPRFPAGMETAVAARIGAWVDRVKPKFGFASAACGSDILFLEAMLQRGAEVSVVLPYNEEEFVRDSVDFVAGSNWPERFRRVLARATRVLTASSAKLAIGGVSYEFCNQFLLGLGAIRARQLETELIPLVVWNGQSGDGPGGASSVVEDWRALGCEPEIIFLEKEEAEQAARNSAAQTGPEISGRKSMSEQKPAGTSSFNSRLVSILFADAVGFSKLT
ncbi:MAG TPA: TRAFs-binding domain-containing protein, partial [Chthoniobacterales bacterium]